MKPLIYSKLLSCKWVVSSNLHLTKSPRALMKSLPPPPPAPIRPFAKIDGFRVWGWWGRWKSPYPRHRQYPVTASRDGGGPHWGGHHQRTGAIPRRRRQGQHRCRQQGCERPEENFCFARRGEVISRAVYGKCVVYQGGAQTSVVGSVAWPGVNLIVAMACGSLQDGESPSQNENPIRPCLVFALYL